jgi:hypothetical protein
MTLRTNARVAGVTYFLYLAAGIASLVLAGRTQETDLAVKGVAVPAQRQPA